MNSVVRGNKRRMLASLSSSPSSRFLVFSESAPDDQGECQADIVGAGPDRPANDTQDFRSRSPTRYQLTDAATLKVDNMGALAATREENGAIVWMTSDVKFSALRKSLLLTFELLGRSDTVKAPDPEHQNEKAGASPGFSTFESD